MRIIFDQNEIDFDIFSTDVFNYGFGIFETVKIYKGRCIFLEEHLARMQESLKTLGMGEALNNIEIKEKISNLIEKKSVAPGVLKLNYFKGPDDDYLLIRSINKDYDKGLYEKGVDLKISSYKKNEHSSIVLHKTNNYMENILEKRRGEEEGFFDSLFLNSSGFIGETTIANIFFICEGIVCTPNVETGILPGIMRKKVIEIAKKQGIDVKEGFYTKDIIEDSQGAFITNSVLGIMPVKKIGEKEYKLNNKETTLLIKEYNNVLCLYCGM